MIKIPIVWKVVLITIAMGAMASVSKVKMPGEVKSTLIVATASAALLICAGDADQRPIACVDDMSLSTMHDEGVCLLLADTVEKLRNRAFREMFAMQAASDVCKLMVQQSAVRSRRYLNGFRRGPRVSQFGQRFAIQ